MTAPKGRFSAEVATAMSNRKIRAVSGPSFTTGQRVWALAVGLLSVVQAFPKRRLAARRSDRGSIYVSLAREDMDRQVQENAL